MILVISILLIVGLVTLDLGVKSYINGSIGLSAEHVIIHHLFDITNIRNYGMSFGLLQNYTWIFIIFALIVLVILINELWTWRHTWNWSIMLSFLIAGTIGNSASRIFNGYVTDMFQPMFWNLPVFNVADTCLTIGIILFIFIVVCNKEKVKA